MANLAQPRNGTQLKIAARGFPCFYGKKRLARIITGDIWAFLRHISSKKLKKQEATQALSYIDQAFDFYTVAANPRQATRPLLYYYAFLNLAKVLLLHKEINLPPAIKHGIVDPKANARERLHFKTQIVRINNPAHDHSELFPELIRCLAISNTSTTQSEEKPIDLLRQVPAIHRTYCQVTLKEPIFCPIEILTILHDKEHVWVNLRLSKHDRDVQRTIKSITAAPKFKNVFRQVKPLGTKRGDEYLYESDHVKYYRRGIDSAIGKLADKVRSCGIWTILTRNGYSYYLNGGQEQCLPQLCSAYAIMYYLGSLVRYKPYDFSKIIKGYSWVISEFIDTQPAQFLHILASYLAETEVVLPHAKGL